MTRARLRALRLVGFKSFAERTTVEFGPGISAVVGPNGSGKSNLADALRWILGEQGRGLRTRRSEDVIFAGSARRHAIGMADATLVVDNTDRLLPVDYDEVELGRRLYRSGENEYLLNRQRVRLRDLVDLLDAANIADNAFLFIGQGMVDQALALRPEERRPLFEEAAGIRRHERRRRRAEAELAEADANLERLRDLLGELRPQARRLAAQAEQQAARRSAGRELAEATVSAARERLVEGERRALTEAERLAAMHAQADAALASLRLAEEAVARLSDALADEAETERTLRAAHDGARARMTELLLAVESATQQVAALARDRERATAELEVLEARAVAARRTAAMPLPEVDPEIEADLGRLERELAEAAAALDEARGASRAANEQEARLRRLRAAREADLERARQVAARAERQLADQRARLAHAQEAWEAAQGAAAQRTQHARLGEAAESASASAADAARTAWEAAAAERQRTKARLAESTATAHAVRRRIEALDAVLEAGEPERLVRAARARGGRRLAEDLDVDASLRAAVEAALGPGLRAVIVPHAIALGLEDQHGTLLVQPDETPAAARATRTTGRIDGGADKREAELAARAAGGGVLLEAVRRDPAGAATRLLRHALWVPSLAAALELLPVLPVGWRVATTAGALIDSEGLVRLGTPEALLERRAERDRAAREAEAAAQDLKEAAEVAEGAGRRHLDAQSAFDHARSAHDAARRHRREADEAERASARRAEAAARELAWERAQFDRLSNERDRLDEILAALEREAESDGGSGRGSAAAARPGTRGFRDDGLAEGVEVRAREAQVSALRERRDTARRRHETASRLRRTAEDERQRAEVTLALDDARRGVLEEELRRVAGATAEEQGRLQRLSADLAAAREVERGMAARLEAAVATGARSRGDLLAAERAASEARERLRAAEGRSRAAEVVAVEARLGWESAREKLLVELAALGADGYAAMSQAAGRPPPADTPDGDRLGPELEQALDGALERWRAGASHGMPEEAEAPAPARLASLRRRYHELGASNPFAAEEYAELSTRLQALEAQRGDLETAIGTTRELIGELNALIARQFRATFRALEDAFARRFQQLFDGGEAELVLTAPDDLTTTGVEISARPPGKKRQPLAMLSGGERALTAVALLLAMLEVRPVPFCVLDEVDAALDEANVERFSAALRGLADRIQFIVITHNRGTIEGADALYGVTLGEDAVSRVVSLRLADLVPAGGTARPAARPRAGDAAPVTMPRARSEPIAIPIAGGDD